MSWARRSNSAWTVALRSLIGETRSPGSRMRLGQPGRLSGKPGPDTEDRVRRATPRSYRGRRGDAPRKAPYATSLVRQRWGAPETADGYREPYDTSRTIRQQPGGQADCRGARHRDGRDLVHPGMRTAGLKQTVPGIRVANDSHAEEARGRCRNGKPQPPQLDGNLKHCIKGNPQWKLRSDDLLKAFGGPSKLTGITLPGRRSGGRGRRLPRSPRTRRRPSSRCPVSSARRSATD